MGGYFAFLLGFMIGLVAGFITAVRQIEKINGQSDARILKILEK